MADVIFGIGSVLFAVALLPSVLRWRTPAISTSLLTAAVLSVFILAYANLHFWFALTTDAITALLWWVLFVQGCILLNRETADA
jgi:hypothetical protein